MVRIHTKLVILPPKKWFSLHSKEVNNVVNYFNHIIMIINNTKYNVHLIFKKKVRGKSNVFRLPLSKLSLYKLWSSPYHKPHWHWFVMHYVNDTHIVIHCNLICKFDFYHQWYDDDIGIDWSTGQKGYLHMYSGYRK